MPGPFRVRRKHDRRCRLVNRTRWRCADRYRTPGLASGLDGVSPAVNRAARLGRWPSELIQFIPLIVFVNAGRFGFDFEERFLAGAGAALVAVALLVALRVRMNPLLVGVQVWLLIEASSFVVYIPPLVDALKALRESSLFLVIIVVGSINVSRSKSLLSVDGVEAGAARRASLVLLGLAGLAFLFSLALRGDEVIAGVIPSVVLFVVQAILSARARRAAPT